MTARRPDATPHTLPDAAAARVGTFRDARWTAGVVGLGYVGLPLAVTARSSSLVRVSFQKA
jgi:hypothetical protein